MKTQLLLAIAFLSCAVAAQNRGPVDLANAPVAPGARRIAYGNAPLQFGELRLPSTKGPHPVGGSPAERPERYRDGSPIELLPLGVPQAFFTGRMFAAHAAPYEIAARRAGDVVQISALPGADHFAFIDPRSDIWLQVLSLSLIHI